MSIEQPPESEGAAPVSSPARKPASLRYIMWLVVSLLCHLGITWTLTNVVGLPAQSAFLCSLITVTAVNFVGLRRFVFRSTQYSIRQQLIRYLVMNLIQRAGEYFAFDIINRYAQPSVVIAVPVVLGLSTLVRYFIYKYLVFIEPKTVKATAAGGEMK